MPRPRKSAQTTALHPNAAASPSNAAASQTPSVPAGSPNTPMFVQYQAIKAEHPDALLFFRMGDFYELFFEDAETAARELNLTLTCRNPNAENPVSMAGVPHHAAQGYLKKLLDKGYVVALCDQLEDPKKTKGLVKRGVTRIYTPGTVVEEDGLDATEHNHLAALYLDEERGGLAFVDFSTGEWSGFEGRAEDVVAWTAKIAPKELLVPDGQALPGEIARLDARIARPTRHAFEAKGAESRIARALSAASTDALGLADKPLLTRTLAALVDHLVRTQKRDPADLGEFKPLTLGEHLVIDATTERNLELFKRLDGGTGPGTLIAVLDRTHTPMGARLIRERLKKPWRDKKRVLAAQAMTEAFFLDPEFTALAAKALASVSDLERIAVRAQLGRALPKDFTALKAGLAALPGLGELVRELGGPPFAGIAEFWEDLAEVRDPLERSFIDNPPSTVTEGGLFKPGFDQTLDELVELAEHGEARMAALLESERTEHGLPRLKLGYNRVFGHYFELPSGLKDKAPAHFIAKQTLAGGERYTTEALKALEERALSAAEDRKAREYALFQELRELVAAAAPRIRLVATLVAQLDVARSLGEIAKRFGWTRPLFTADADLTIVQGRHPVVESVQTGEDFIPNDLALNDEARLLLVTGPNMAGKSTILRQAAVIAALAQMGSFVPAARAELPLFDRLFSRVGASDNLAQGRSTFMVEMIETAAILRQASGKCLVILDEIGRGTSTFDGLAIAWAVVEDLARRQGGVRTLFATHYHELTVLEGPVKGVHNAAVAVAEQNGKIVFLRRLVPGPADRSYGVEVAELAGTPRPVVRRAREILKELEAGRLSRDEHIAKSAQALLPGFAPAAKPAKRADAPADHTPEAKRALKLASELAAVNLDALTPLDALTLLHALKLKYADQKTTPKK